MNPIRGITLKLTAVVLFSVMAALVKASAGSVPPGQQVFFRSFFAMPVVVMWLMARGELGAGLRVNSLLSHFLRGIVGTLAMGAMFWGLGLLPLPEATALGYTMSLLVVLFAAMFLNERVGIWRLSMVALGFSGVMIVLFPRLTALDDGVSLSETLGAVATLIGASFAALAQIFVRKMVATERATAIAFWFAVTSTILSLTTLPFGWVLPDPRTGFLLICTGLVGGMAQIAMTSGYRYADASMLAPLDYASMVTALALGWFVFGELPTLPMLSGAVVIIAAGIAIILRERYLGLQRSRARKAQTPV